MNLLKKSIILITVALLKLPASGFAQYQFQVEPLFNYFSDAKRYEISGTYVLPQGEIAGLAASTTKKWKEQFANELQHLTNHRIKPKFQFN